MSPDEYWAMPLLANCNAAGSTSACAGVGDGFFGAAVENGIEGGRVFDGVGTGVWDGTGVGLAAGDSPLPGLNRANWSFATSPVAFSIFTFTRSPATDS